MPGRPWRDAPGGLMLTVRLTPKGGRDAIDGIVDLADGTCALKARVRAVAREGEANAALIRLLAGAIGIAASDVSLAAGATARLKQLAVSGDGTALAEALEKICAIG